MKNYLLLMLCFCFLAQKTFCQVSITNDSSSPDPSAQLDVKAANKGMLIPRLNDHTTIPLPARGLIVFNNTSNSFWYFNTVWNEISDFKLPYSGVFNTTSIILNLVNNANATVANFTTQNGIGVAGNANDAGGIGVWANTTGDAAGSYGLLAEAKFANARAIYSNGKLQFVGIGEDNGKILTSDTNGNASWQYPVKYDTYTISPVAFMASNSADVLYKATGGGGAYFKNVVEFDGMSAPLNLPNGSRVTKITAYYKDFAPSDMNINFYGELLDVGSFDSFAGAITSGSANTYQSIELAAGLFTPYPFTIHNDLYSYSIKLYSIHWPAAPSFLNDPALVIKGIKIEYNYDVK